MDHRFRIVRAYRLRVAPLERHRWPPWSFKLTRLGHSPTIDARRPDKAPASAPQICRNALRRSRWFLSISALMLLSASAHADVPGPTASTLKSKNYLVDRVVVRFDIPDLGGPKHPRFIFARVLAFEARLEALSEARQTRRVPPHGYNDRQVQRALERHISEEILVHLPMSPRPTADDIRMRAAVAYTTLEQRAGGRAALLDAAYAEGLEMPDIIALIRRRAMASLYLDRMVSPMLNPSDTELQEVLRSQRSPFRGQSFKNVAPDLRRWYISRQMRRALASFFRSARSRIHIVIVPEAR